MKLGFRKELCTAVLPQCRVAAHVVKTVVSWLPRSGPTPPPRSGPSLPRSGPRADSCVAARADSRADSRLAAREAVSTTPASQQGASQHTSTPVHALGRVAQYKILYYK